MGINRDDLISPTEAAKVLGISRSRVYQLARINALPAEGEFSSGMKFSLRKVVAYGEARAGKKSHSLGLDGAQRRIEGLEATVAEQERRLEALERLLGLDAPTLSYEEVDVVAMDWKAKEALKDPSPSLEDVVEWAGVLSAVHQEYLGFIERYTNNPEPWAVLSRAGEHVYRNGPSGSELDHIEARPAYKSLSRARAHLLRVAWAYQVQHHGIRAAQATFPETDPDLITYFAKRHCHP